jgi:hypothetical protein
MAATTTIAIRPVQREDFPLWRGLFDGYNAFYGRAGLTKLPEEIVLTTWSRFFDYYEPMHALVAERARQAGSSRVYWQTHETNSPAMRLYDKVAEKSGFLVYRHLL